MGSTVFETVYERSEEDEEDEGNEQPTDLTVYVYTHTQKPEGWNSDWFTSAEKVVWGYQDPVEEEDDEDKKDKR